jgi:hypothetical protein
MSDVASEAVNEIAPQGTSKLVLVKGSSAVEDGPPGPMEEHPSDLYETALEYDHSSRMPILVILVWVCAVIGFASYLAAYYFPDLALWGKP